MILLLGATGHLGQAFAAELQRRGLPFVPLSRRTIDYTRFDVLFDYVRRSKPRLLINAAGYTGRPTIDDCEIHRAETVQANTLLPQTVARVCYLTNTPWGHVSSGNIFSGAKVLENGAPRVERDLNSPEIRHSLEGNPTHFSGFVETDEPNFSFRSPPCSFYSGTKALAEEALRWYGESYIWRPRVIFDEFDHPRNFLSKIQVYPRIHDSVNSLTHRGDFVRACLDLWERGAPFGTYHVINAGAIATREVVAMIESIRKPSRHFEFWKDDEEFYREGVKARRSNCLLDSSKLLAAGVKLRPVREAIEDSLQRWQPARQKLSWVEDILKAMAVRQV